MSVCGAVPGDGPLGQFAWGTNFALPSTAPSSCPTQNKPSDTLTRLDSGVAGAHGFQATSCESSLQKCWYMPNKLIIWGRFRGECQKVFPSMDQKNLLAP